MNQNDMAGACNYLNEVRVARGAETLDTTSAADLLQTLKLEYLAEMRGEGQIFFLHKRFNQSFATTNAIYNAHEAANRDNPAVSIRYNVPIPSGENY